MKDAAPPRDPAPGGVEIWLLPRADTSYNPEGTSGGRPRNPWHVAIITAGPWPSLPRPDPPHMGTMTFQLPAGLAPDWAVGGLQVGAPLQQRIDGASRRFVRAIAEGDSPGVVPEARAALAEGYAAAGQLVQAYVGQVFQVRHQRQPRLDTALGCRL